MTPARLKLKTAVAQIDLPRLDRLIDSYLTNLLEHTENVRLNDFTKLVEMRHRISPTDDAAHSAWKEIESARASQLTNPEAPEQTKEEPPE